LYFFVSGSLTRLNGGAWYFDTGDGGFYLTEMPKFFLILGEKIAIAELFVMIIFLVLVVVNFIKKGNFSIKEKKWEIFFGWEKEAVLALILFIVPLLAGFVLQLWVAKYFTISATGFYLLAAFGFNKLFRSGRIQLAVGVTILILFLPFIISISLNQSGHQWGKVAEYLVENEKVGDKIFLPAFVYELPLRYYYKGETEILSLAPSYLETDVLTRAVKYNWAPLKEAGNIPRMGDVVNDINRVLIVYPVVPAPIHRAEKVLDWFIFNRWCLESRKQFWGFEQPAVFIFVNPKSSEMGECERKNAQELD